MMDNGTHFFKCDFQVHTPRDLNWNGAEAVTEAERQLCAQEFVAACRRKALQGVAITDHHDLVFFKYIRNAALGETDDGGAPLPKQERLVVFPGLELTLAVPCQALLILDADFSTQLLPQVLQALSIAPAPEGDSRHAPINRLDHIKTLEALHEELDKREFLVGHYIVLPHVGESGDFSLLRKGFAPQYKNMRCVGGFVDGSVAQLGTGKTAIVSGKTKEWGNKAIAVFQTSDSRSRDFAALGTNVTWVKWAQPTAEALRQACLARHSRISHSQPTMPTGFVTRLEVTNSKFLGPLNLDLNPQYNAIIGGRGTGKSTVLEYLRWGLCDQPAAGDLDEAADFQRRRQTLIENTLIPLNATVDVFLLLDGVEHVVRRKAGGELFIRIGEAAFQQCTEQNVRDLFPIRAYSQKQLSAVGARLDELRRFVHAPVHAALAALDERMSQLSSELRSAFGRLQRFRALRTEVTAHELERQSLTERVAALRGSLAGLSTEDRHVIDQHAEFVAEQRLVLALERDAQSAKDAIAHAASELDRLPAPADGGARSQNANLIQDMRGTLETWLGAARAELNGLLKGFEESAETAALNEFVRKAAEWRVRKEEHQQAYDGAKRRAAVAEETLGQIQSLESRLAELDQLADLKAEQLRRLGEPELGFSEFRNEWKSAHRERADLLETQCSRLSAIPKTRLRAALRRAADTAPLAEQLRQAFKGTKTRAEKVETLVAQVAAASEPLGAWHAILDELQALAWLHSEDDATTILPTVARLDAAGFTQKEKLALARQLDPPGWLELLLHNLRDLPVFEYQVRDSDFMPFQDASPGQQATTLLSILLLQDGPPLIIDQPEDDLNMKVINEIVETLWHAKAHRQVIFTSHNANLVVNGDAELVIGCDYRTSSTESGGQIRLTGAIDMLDVRAEITEVMEGGPEAFQLRRQKYGF